MITQILPHKKDMVKYSLISLEVKSQQIIRSNRFFMWDILLPMPEMCEVISRELIKQDYILMREYLVRLRTNVTDYEVPAYVMGEQLCIYLMQYEYLVCHPGT